MRTKIKGKKLQCAVYDFKDGKIVTQLPGDIIVTEGKRKIKIPRFASREFCPEVLELMKYLMIWEKLDEYERLKVPSKDKDIAIINSYLVHGKIDNTYNDVTDNPCVFTDSLKQEIDRLWEEKIRKEKIYKQKRTKK